MNRDEEGRFASSPNQKMNTLIRRAAGRDSQTVTTEDSSPEPQGPAGLDGGAGRDVQAQPFDMNRMIRRAAGRNTGSPRFLNGLPQGH